jgi:hypothetical protein
MDLSYAQLGYFITQVALSAASFGVAEADISDVGQALEMLFDYKCSPPTTIIPAQGAQLQSICTGDGCPLDPNAVCDKYQNFSAPTSVMPSGATATSSMMASGITAASGTSSMSAQASKAAAAGNVIPAGLALLGAAFAYLL